MQRDEEDSVISSISQTHDRSGQGQGRKVRGSTDRDRERDRDRRGGTRERRHRREERDYQIDPSSDTTENLMVSPRAGATDRARPSKFSRLKPSSSPDNAAGVGAGAGGGGGGGGAGSGGSSPSSQPAPMPLWLSIVRLGF